MRIQYTDYITAEGPPIRLSFSHAILPAVVNKLPHLMHDFSTNLERASHPFPVKNHHLFLEVLIFIPTDLLSVATCQCMLEVFL